MVIGGAGYLGLRSVREKADPNSADLALPFTVRVTRGSVQQAVIAPGVLVSTRRVVLGAKIGGWLAEINVRPGDACQAEQGGRGQDGADRPGGAARIYGPLWTSWLWNLCCRS